MKKNKIFLCVTLLFVCLFFIAEAQAATFTVLNLNDSGTGSLRQAISDANDLGGADTILFQDGLTGTITLTGGQLVITDSVTITGPGARVLTVSGNHSSRVFDIAGDFATINISGITIANGFADASHGGGIRNNVTNTLNLDGVTVTDNSASGHGGGILNYSTLNIINSTISYNVSPSNGGGINNNLGGILNISNSTISDNTATGADPIYGNAGGGIINFNQMSLNNVTISNNNASTVGGGISNRDEYSAVTYLRNTIIAANTVENGNTPDVSGTFASLGNNLISNTSGSTGFGAAGDILDQPANLGELQNNGGQTDTRALLEGSLAIDAGNNCVVDNSCITAPPVSALTTDQRGEGFSRLQGESVDIGAFEVQAAPEELIEDLIELVKSYKLHHGIENALLAKLKAALKALSEGDTEKARESIQSFINQVKAQKGKKITQAQASDLIEAAEEILIALE